MISFEFDPAKSETNRTKHGIDFVEAQDLWHDPMLLEIPVRTDGHFYKFPRIPVLVKPP